MQSIELKKIRARSWEGMLFNYVFALAKGEDEPHPDFIQFVGDDGILAVTPTMVAKGYETTANTATRALTSMGMIIEQKNVRTQTGSKKTRLYIVPNENVWREIVQRYYYTDEGSEDKYPECPEILKSRRYRAGMN